MTRRACRTFAWAMAVAALAIVATAPHPAHAERRQAASFSYCGLGHGAADSSMEPGGGGDTLVIGDPREIYHFVYDSSSPVTLQEHDRVIFAGLQPSEFSFKRVDDSLVICHPARRYELVIDRHYCSAKALSTVDIPNHEIEELAFISAGEIWLADALFAEWQKAPESFPPIGGQRGDYVHPEPGGTWKVRPFSEVLPDYATPSIGCP